MIIKMQHPSSTESVNAILLHIRVPENNEKEMFGIFRMCLN